MTTEDLVAAALRRFDEENAADPHTILVDGVTRPRELVQAERLDAWVHRVTDAPSVPLRLAARCQHLCRWQIPRSDYPEGRVGYLKWRKDLAHFHAQKAESILRDVGFDEETITALRTINLKQALKTNPDTQRIEDALCLSFLEHEIGEFAEKYDDDKLIDILQKTWRKMSSRGHELALALTFPERVQSLIGRALGAA